MKVIIEKDGCIGCGLCASICPDVFKMGNGEKAEAISDEINTDMEPDCHQAVADCPVNVIKVVN